MAATHAPSRRIDRIDVAPKRRIDRINDLMQHYQSLADERPLTKEENAEAVERYHELLYEDSEPLSEERRKELGDMYDKAHKAHLAPLIARLVNDDERARLIENGRQTAAGEDIDPVPVVRLFSPAGTQSWLLTELAEDNDVAYGLCDIGIGLPECGEVRLSWLAEQNLQSSRTEHRSSKEERSIYMHMGVERDPAFPRADTPTLSYLDKAAFAAGKIII